MHIISSKPLLLFTLLMVFVNSSLGSMSLMSSDSMHEPSNNRSAQSHLAQSHLIQSKSKSSHPCHSDYSMNEEEQQSQCDPNAVCNQCTGFFAPTLVFFSIKIEQTNKVFLKHLLPPSSPNLLYRPPKITFA